MQNSLISRTGRRLTSLWRFRHHTIAGRLLRLVRMALQVLVWWPALIAGAVLVVTFLTMKVNGSAEAQWVQALEARAAAYQDAPPGYVLSTRCDTDRNASPSADIPGMEVSAPCPPHPVSLVKEAQADIATLTSFYMTLVVLSLLWLLVSEFMLPVATPRHHSGESHSGRSARSYVTYRDGNIVIRTPDGEFRAVLIRHDKEGKSESGTNSAGEGGHE